MDYTYTGVMPLSSPTSRGNHFTSQFEGDRSGTDLEYGVEMIYPLANTLGDKLTINVHGSNMHWRQQGTTFEMLTGGSGALLSSADWRVNNPSLHRNDLTASAHYLHTYTRTQGIFELDYSYQREAEDEERCLQAMRLTNFNAFAQSRLLTDALTQRHKVRAHRVLVKQAHTFGWGARYENQLITAGDRQWLDQAQTLDDHFRHALHTAAAFAEYWWRCTKGLDLHASLEYDYTHMEGRHLHDYIPHVSINYRPATSQDLSLSYSRRIIRPTLSLLNPARIRGSYTLDYGNPDLIGTHANTFELRYLYKPASAQVSATLRHMRADDGFNAIWMERDGIRQSTWQNEGVRRAWSLTGNARWTMAKRTTLQAEAEVMWDKRIAEAIHMENAHWGGKVGAALRQQFAHNIWASVDCNYSQGYTLDLYSHTGRTLRYGAEVGKSFLRERRLTATLSYHHCHYPDIVLTQGAYVGSLFQRSTSGHQAQVQLAYRFGK